VVERGEVLGGPDRAWVALDPAVLADPVVSFKHDHAIDMLNKGIRKNCAALCRYIAHFLAIFHPVGAVVLANLLGILGTPVPGVLVQSLWMIAAIAAVALSILLWITFAPRCRCGVALFMILDDSRGSSLDSPRRNALIALAQYLGLRRDMRDRSPVLPDGKNRIGICKTYKWKPCRTSRRDRRSSPSSTRRVYA